MRISSPLTFIVALALSGCAHRPAADALHGEPGAFIAMVASGAVGSNDYIPVYDADWTMTPLCISLHSTLTAQTVDFVLERGADVNKRCRPAEDTLPLDVVIHQLVARGSAQSAYTASRTHRPEDLPLFHGHAQKLLQRGAVSSKGPLTMAQVRQRVNQETAGMNVYRAEVQDRYDKTVSERNSVIAGVFTAAAVVGGAVVIGKAASTANTSASTIASSLTSAVPPAQTSPSAAQSGTAARTQQPVSASPVPVGPVRSVSTGPAASSSGNDRRLPFNYHTCVTSHARETINLTNSAAFSQHWTMVAAAEQNRALGRCEDRTEVSSRARQAGQQKIVSRSATIIEERMLCDIGEGGATVARFGWYCEMWARAT
ncbi:MAG: hypothetical protein JWP22_413, partial [Ramlibacter sp.]|nr:hypothetical protein [Ramlibacter sp.]